MFTILRRLALLPLLGLLGCGGESTPADAAAEAGDEEELKAAGSYVPILDYWKTEADQNRWLDVRRNLDQAFDTICGDTFCGGDYSNLESLGFNCSVAKKTGRVAECVWTFAGSQESVNAKTGQVAVDAPHYLCRLPTKAFATAVLTGLEADPLRAIVPGTKTSLYDLIGECFNRPTGGTPLPATPAGSHVETPRPDASEADQSAWYDGRFALKQSFDNVCGDTFCSGDYSNIQSLRFVCGVNGKTDELGQCLWAFAGSYDTVAAKDGKITSNVKRFLCPVPVKGKASVLGATLAAPGPIEVIQRILPGTTRSAYDALTGCL